MRDRQGGGVKLRPSWIKFYKKILKFTLDIFVFLNFYLTAPPPPSLEKFLGTKRRHNWSKSIATFRNNSILKKNDQKLCLHLMI